MDPGASNSRNQELEVGTGQGEVQVLGGPVVAGGYQADLHLARGRCP